MDASSIKIERALFALTMDDQRRILTDAALLIEGDTITQVGKSSELAGVAADQTIDASDFVITPGFIGGHMHISYAHATRGIFPDDLGPDYLPNVFKLQGIMSPDEERLTSLLAITELLKYGTTTFVDPGSTKHIAACMESYRASGCRIVTGAQVTDRPNPLNVPAYDTDEALAITRSTIADFDGELDGMVSAWAMPFSSEYASPELLSGAARIAKDKDTRSLSITASAPRGRRLEDENRRHSHGVPPRYRLPRRRRIARPCARHYRRRCRRHRRIWGVGSHVSSGRDQGRLRHDAERAAARTSGCRCESGSGHRCAEQLQSY